MNIKRLCKKRVPTHSEASKILKQLERNPEVCETCKIRPCSFALYVWGYNK